MPWTIDFEDIFEEDLPLSDEASVPSTSDPVSDDELSEQDELRLAALIEIVDEFDFEAVDEPPVSAPALTDRPVAFATIPSGPPEAAASETPAAALAPTAASDSAGGDATNAPVATDPFARFVHIAEDVARQMGGDPCTLAAFLDEHGTAWRAILRGESNDLGACGSMSLDEWTAEAIARTSGAPTRASSIRQELRARGVAAFGLLADAA